MPADGAGEGAGDPTAGGSAAGAWTWWNRARYTLYAPVYDLALARLPLFARGRRRSIELAALRPGETVVLVAAGTGLDLAYLPDGVHVIATDLTPAMARRCAGRAARLAKAGRQLDVRTEIMNAQRLALPDASVDCVVLHLALAVVPDPVAAIREAARVLRPGGRVAVFDKFLPDGQEASLARRGADVVARVAATTLNRRLAPLLDAAGLVETRREAVGLGGTFVVARAERRRAG